MVIKIDIHNLNEKFKSVIIDDINTEYQHNLKNHTNAGDDDKDINPGSITIVTLLLWIKARARVICKKLSER